MKYSRPKKLPSISKLHWYEINSVLGEGGYGLTYEGLDTNLNQKVAIKEYFPSSYASRDENGQIRPLTDTDEEIFIWGLNRFLQEAQTLARLQHSNIVRVFSVFEARGSAYIVMEFVEGVSLKHTLRVGSIRDESSLSQCGDHSFRSMW